MHFAGGRVIRQSWTLAYVIKRGKCLFGNPESYDISTLIVRNKLCCR